LSFLFGSRRGLVLYLRWLAFLVDHWQLAVGACGVCPIHLLCPVMRLGCVRRTPACRNCWPSGMRRSWAASAGSRASGAGRGPGRAGGAELEELPEARRRTAWQGAGDDHRVALLEQIAWCRSTPPSKLPSQGHRQKRFAPCRRWQSPPEATVRHRATALLGPGASRRRSSFKAGSAFRHHARRAAEAYRRPRRRTGADR
jgi:hypothetical protein